MRIKKINIFIEHSMINALAFLKEAVFSEEAARSKGLLQSISPRMKIIALILCLIITCLIRSIPVILAVYIVSLILAKSSGIGILFFIKRVWFFIPMFTLLIALPAVFMYGIFPAVIFVLRVATCVSLAVLVTITTRHADILRSLRSIGIPELFIQVLDMTYRYIFFFIKIFEEMHLSLKSRLIGRLSNQNTRRWAASRISFLFTRSIKMSEDVYRAMLARGYTGEVKKYGG